MNKRAFNIAYVDAELRAKLAIQRFTKEFENVPKQPQPVQPGQVPPTNQPNGNVPQQPQYGG